MNKNVKVVKVKPYPIKCTLKYDETEICGYILRLTSMACLINIQKQSVHVGNKLKVQFSIPVKNHNIIANTMVIKVTSTLSAEDQKVNRIIECHFIDLHKEYHEFIQKFCIDIGQK